MRDRDDERIFPPGVVPVFVALLGLVAAVVLAGILAVAITRCDPESPQMVPDAPQTVIASASAQVFATQSVRVTVSRAPTASQRLTSQEPQEGPRKAAKVSQHPTRQAVEADRGDEIVIEVSQGVIAGTSASTVNDYLTVPNYLQSVESSHGHLGIIVATMPGILAADLQLLRLDVSPLTRWLVDVPLEVGVDAVGNLEAGGVGVSAGGKAFALAGVWSRWNLSGQGVGLGVGLRF